MAQKIKFSLSAQISSVLLRLSRTLDSFWFFLISIFSHRNTPNEDKQSQHTGDIELQRNPQAVISTFVKSHKLLLEILALPLAVATIAGFYLSWAPKLSVDASESIASFSPMGTIFKLSNEGALEIHDVVVSCANLQIDGENLKVWGPWEFTNVPPDAKADVLSPGHTMSLPYAPGFGFTGVGNFKGAQLTIIVRYRPAYLFWRKQEIFPFRAVRTVNGSWVWKSIAQ